MNIHGVPIARIRIDEDGNSTAPGNLPSVVHHISQADNAGIWHPVQERRRLRAGEKERFEAHQLAHARQQRTECTRHD